jgi:hypothetical protein
MSSTFDSLRVIRSRPRAGADHDETEEQRQWREQLDQIREDAADAIKPKKTEPTTADPVSDE